MTRWSSSGYRRLVATSENDGAVFRRIAGDRVTVIENGADLGRFGDAGSPTLVRTLIYFGRWSANKGLPQALDLLAALRSQGGAWRLIVAGRPADLRVGDLEALRDARGLGDAVEFHPSPDDATLRALMSRASYFVCLSRHEGFGIAAIEALSAGLIPLLSDIPPFRKIVDESDCGRLLPLAATAVDHARCVIDLHAAGDARAWRERRIAFTERYEWPPRRRPLRGDVSGSPPAATLAGAVDAGMNTRSRTCRSAPHRPLARSGRALLCAGLLAWGVARRRGCRGMRADATGRERGRGRVSTAAGNPAAYARDYIYPAANEIALMKRLGLKLMRVPFLWERVQPKALAPLDAAELGRLDEVVHLADLAGLTVVLDVHNYGTYHGVSLDRPEAPKGALPDLWKRLAQHYGGDGNVVFGLMNEPKDIDTDAWAAIAAATLASIRATGARNIVLVPGTHWDGAHSWLAGAPHSNADALLPLAHDDPRVVFEVHQYFDDNFSGTGPTCGAAAKIPPILARVGVWARVNHVRMMLGEFGVSPRSGVRQGARRHARRHRGRPRGLVWMDLLGGRGLVGRLPVQPPGRERRQPAGEGIEDTCRCARGPGLSARPLNAIQQAALPDVPPAGEHQPATSRAVTDHRIGFIDNARALGILLVVVGHAPALPAAASDFIFAFHMPLFFLLSGLVVGESRLHMPVARRLVLLAKSLLLPYLFYVLVSYAYWLLFKRHGLHSDVFEQLPWWDPLAGALKGTADGLYFNVVLWFFPCLFIVALAHHGVGKFLPRPLGAAVFVAAAAAFVLLHGAGDPRWPWSADCAVVGAAFYATGAAFNPRLKRSGAAMQPALLVSTAVIGFAICYLLTRSTGHVDLNHLSFGRWPMLYLPMGAIGIVATLALSAALPASRIARWLSMNTLTIFPLHFLMFSVVTGVALTVFHLAPDFKDGGWPITVVYTGAALAMCWPAAGVIRRLLAWYWTSQERPA